MNENAAGSTQGFNEDHALVFLQRRDLAGEMLTSLARNPDALKSRKVVLALIAHPRTPRHASIPLLRRVFTFDLVQVTLTPAIAADLKRAAEEQILLRLETLSTGERITLAKRASGRVAAALLRDSDTRIVEPALDNAQLTEPLVVEALMTPRVPAILFDLASSHRNWCQRREIQIALLRSEKTPLENAQELAQNFSEEVLHEILPEERRKVLLNSLATIDSPPAENSKSGDSE
jgi:hypothetical protein